MTELWSTEIAHFISASRRIFPSLIDFWAFSRYLARLPLLLFSIGNFISGFIPSNTNTDLIRGAIAVDLHIVQRIRYALLWSRQYPVDTNTNKRLCTTIQIHQYHKLYPVSRLDSFCEHIYWEIAAGFVFPYQSINFDKKSMDTKKSIQLEKENEETAMDEE